MMETETRAAQPPARAAWSPRSWERQEGPPLGPLEGTRPGDPWVSDFWPPELGENELLWLWCVVLCCGGHRMLEVTHWSWVEGARPSRADGRLNAQGLEGHKVTLRSPGTPCSRGQPAMEAGLPKEGTEGQGRYFSLGSRSAPSLPCTAQPGARGATQEGPGLCTRPIHVAHPCMLSTQPIHGACPRVCSTQDIQDGRQGQDNSGPSKVSHSFGKHGPCSPIGLIASKTAASFAPKCPPASPVPQAHPARGGPAARPHVQLQ